MNTENQPRSSLKYHKLLYTISLLCYSGLDLNLVEKIYIHQHGFYKQLVVWIRVISLVCRPFLAAFYSSCFLGFFSTAPAVKKKRSGGLVQG